MSEKSLSASEEARLDRVTEDAISLLLIGQNRVMLSKTGTADRQAMVGERDRLRTALRSRIRTLIEEARKQEKKERVLPHD